MRKEGLRALLVLMFALGLPGVALAGTIAYVSQAGDSHEAYIEQVGDFNEAFITQVAEGNEATQTQIGTSNYVYARQEGHGNEAFIEQHGDYNGSKTSAADNREFTFEIDDETHTITSPIFNTSPYTQYQNGNDNTADALIFGSFNNTSQWQQGDRNTATIEITGNDNIAKQVQLSDSNVADITIDGNSNTAYQYQDGGDISTITIQGNGIFVYIEGSGSYSFP